jgi:hypothetical protein
MKYKFGGRYLPEYILKGNRLIAMILETETFYGKDQGLRVS